MELVLASSSPIRRKLLEQLGLDFCVIKPEIDESLLADEVDISAYVQRLARQKAAKIARQCPDALVIAADQACTTGTDIIGKPGSYEQALAQLRSFSGKWLHFHTGLSLARHATGWQQTVLDTWSVKFARLPDADLEKYLESDQPWDCAGSFRLESRGVCLFEDMRGTDHTTLLGLPLMALCRLLRSAGLNPLSL